MPESLAESDRDLRRGDDGWIDIQEAAGHAHLCDGTLYEAAARGELRHVRVGGRRAIRTKREWVDAWLRRYEVGR